MREFIERFHSKSILVVGDFMIDRYVYGEVSRISPEAPVPVLNYQSTQDVPGGAGNTVANLTALGAKVYVVGLGGADEDYKSLCKIINDLGADARGLIADAGRCTTVKKRFIAQKYQLLRMDREQTAPPEQDIERVLCSCVAECIPCVDAVVVSDYAKGVFTKSVADAVYKTAKEHNKILVADVKPKNKALVLNYDVIKPNLKEAHEMTQERIPSAVAESLAQQFNANIVLTMGSEGMLVYELLTGKLEHIKSQARQVCDVTGAGDTVNAVLALSLASCASLFDSACLANIAGGIAVSKLGTSTVSVDELLSAL